MLHALYSVRLQPTYFNRNQIVTLLKYYYSGYMSYCVGLAGFGFCLRVVLTDFEERFQYF